MIYYWCRSASFITGALSSFILNAAVPSQYESKYTREMRRSSGVLFTYFQFACSYLLTSLPPPSTHLCLWSRCSKHSCIAPVWTSADGARALFGLDQHPSTCKPGHLSPSHLKIENCENWEESREGGGESLLWYRAICVCSQGDSSISGLIHDEWTKAPSSFLWLLKFCR